MTPLTRLAILCLAAVAAIPAVAADDQTAAASACPGQAAAELQAGDGSLSCVYGAYWGAYDSAMVSYWEALDHAIAMYWTGLDAGLAASEQAVWTAWEAEQALSPCDGGSVMEQASSCLSTAAPVPTVALPVGEETTPDAVFDALGCAVGGGPDC